MNWVAVDLREKCALDHGIFEKKYTLRCIRGLLRRGEFEGPYLVEVLCHQKNIYICEKISPLFK